MFIIFVGKCFFMARPKNLRKIENPPPVKGFHPTGADSAEQLVIINLEEYESIRLCDFLSLSQEEAALKMGVSRPTLTRIYSIARKKVAEAFVTGKGIVFEGGKVYFDSDWYKCIRCSSLFNNFLHSESPHCSLCGSLEIRPYSDSI